MLLSQYQEDFSAYTLKRFMDDYTSTERMRSERPPAERLRVETLQREFSLIKVKVLLVSLLNGFRDLTLMGVQAFDFNHLNNVLISRDYRKARLIDIDGDSKGSIQFVDAAGKYAGAPVAPAVAEGGGEGGEASEASHLHKPALEIDLSTLLPLVLQQLLFGKGRGKTFVQEQVSRVWRSKSEEDGKELIREAVRENFFPSLPPVTPRLGPVAEPPAAGRAADAARAAAAEGAAQRKHLAKVVEWYYSVLMKRSPWVGWTNDIYDAMRCIDHLPIG